MSNGFGYGLKRAITEILFGIVIAGILDAFAKTNLIPQGYFLLFNIINGLATIALFEAMPVWSTTYLIGWILGMIMLLNSGLITIVDFLSFFVIPVIVLLYRLKMQFC